MEKSTPHCKLSVVKKLIELGRVRATASAFADARELGIANLDGMCAVINALRLDHFYKSMTTHADHKIWQDVYHAQTALGKAVYLKLTVIDDVLIVSFNLETAVGRTQVGLNWRVQLGETRQRPLGRNEEQRRCAWQGRPNWVCSVVTQRVSQLEAKNTRKIRCL